MLALDVPTVKPKKFLTNIKNKSKIIVSSDVFRNGEENMNTTFTETKRVSAAFQVVESINSAIKEGRLKVGDRLPSEQELTGLLGVGRSSLREGVRILVANGLLEVRQGDGTYVTNKFAEKVFEYLGYTANPKGFLMLLELRRVLECGCICSICDTLSQEDYSELEEMAFAIDKKEQTENNIAHDINFHERLFLATNNYLIYEMYRMMSQSLSSLMHEMMQHSEVVIDARDSHIKILEGLKAKDRLAAVAAMNEHLDRIRHYIKIYFDA